MLLAQLARWITMTSRVSSSISQVGPFAILNSRPRTTRSRSLVNASITNWRLSTEMSW